MAGHEERLREQSRRHAEDFARSPLAPVPVIDGDLRALIADLDRMREALEPIRDFAAAYDTPMMANDDAILRFTGVRLTMGHLRAARAALSPIDSEEGGRG